MTAAILATITGVVGVVLGRLWDARSERTRWRRDQKVASYQRILEAFRGTYEAIRTIALADPADASYKTIIQAARNDHRWDDALASVWLHGSRDVVAEAVAMDRAIEHLFQYSQDVLMTNEVWIKARVEVRRRFELFVKAARRELRLGAVRVDFFSATPDANS